MNIKQIKCYVKLKQLKYFPFFYQCTVVLTVIADETLSTQISCICSISCAIL